MDAMSPVEEPHAQPEGPPAAPMPVFDPFNGTGLLRVIYPGQEQPNWAYDEPADGATAFNAEPGYVNIPPLYYTAEAVATSSCSMCNRQFADSAAVLHHLRDHTAHRDSPEAAEAAFVLQRQEESGPAGYRYGPPNGDGAWGGYEQYGQAPWQHAPDYNMMVMSPPYPSPVDLFVPAGSMETDMPLQHDGSQQLAAPPSDAYTGSENGSEQHVMPAMLMAPAQYDSGYTGEGKHGRRRRGGARNRPHHSQQQLVARAPAPKAEEYEQAFPPLSPAAPTRVPVSPPKWGKPTTSTTTQAPAKLRADAQEYQPQPPSLPAIRTETNSPAAEANSSPAVQTPSTPGTPVSAASKALRVDAPAWQPVAA